MKKIEAELTNGQSKIALQFERFTKTDTFKKEVKRIRLLFKIPSKGIKYTEKDFKVFLDKFEFPKRNTPIKIVTPGNERQSEFINLLQKEIKKLNALLPIKSAYLSNLIKNYVLYNRFIENTNKDNFHAQNVCILEDAQQEFNEYAPDDDPDSFFSINRYIERLEEKLWDYPIVLRIHSDASQRDIVEYIKKHWKEIRNHQDKYLQNKSTSFKNSKVKENIAIKERDEFIYKNRHKTGKEIVSLLSNKFGAEDLIDYGHIKKIISLENKRRKV